MNEPVDVIIPVYNEESALPDFLRELEEVSPGIHVIFIDNGSIDCSSRILSGYKGEMTLLTESVNKGYGGAIKRGLAHAMSEKVIVIDADGEYSPDVIPEICRLLDSCDVVYTSRFQKVNTTDMSLARRFGNRMVTRIFNLLFRQQLTDLYTGCKGFRKTSVSGLDLSCDGFEHVLELGARWARNGVRIKETPVLYRRRKDGGSKMNHLKETIKYLFLVFFYYFTLSKT